MIKRSCLLLLLSSVGTSLTYGQVVSGRVLAALSDSALAGASVTLERHGIVAHGAAADSAGRYSLVVTRAGTYRIVARHVGFGTSAAAIHVGEDPVTYDFRLTPVAIGMEEIEIHAERWQLAYDVGVATSRVSARDVQALAGAGEDVLQALRVFPGVQTSGDYSTQLYIRGGTPDQNLIVIDDIEVFSPYQLSGMGSLLNPELVREVELYPGTMPAEYGDRLSSALVVTTREGRTDGALHGRLNTTMMTVNATLEGATGFWDGSWIASGRKTYFGSFANTLARSIGIFNEIAFPNFVDGHFKVTLRPAPHHMMRATVLVSQDRLSWVVDEDAVASQGDTESLQRGDKDLSHSAAGIQWHYVPSAATSVRGYVNWYENRGGSTLGGGLQAWMGGLKNFDSPFGPPDPVFPSDAEATFIQEEAYAVRKVSAGVRAALARHTHMIEAGAGADRLTSALDLDFRANEFAQTFFDAIRMADPLVSALGDMAYMDRMDMRVHAFVQDRIEVAGGALFVQPALRYDYFGIVGQGYLTPRLSLSMPLGTGSTVRFAGGRYVQSPGLEKTLDPDDTYNAARFHSLAGLAAEEAWHAGASLSLRMGRRWHVRLQGYRKWYRALLTQDYAVEPRAVATYFPTGSPEVGRVGPLTPSAWVIAFQESPVLLPGLVNTGRGAGSGAEIIVALNRLRPSDRFSGWLSYALADAWREASYGAGPLRRPFAYDRKHTVSLVAAWEVAPRWTAALTWRFGTGFPYTPATAMRALVVLVEDPNAPGVTQEVVLTDPSTGYARLVPMFGGPENLYAARLPAYHRLDLRVTYEARWEALDVRIYAEAINAYHRRNTITNKYHVGTDVKEWLHLPLALRPPPAPTLYREPIYGFPFVPSLGLSCTF